MKILPPRPGKHTATFDAENDADEVLLLEFFKLVRNHSTQLAATIFKEQDDQYFALEIRELP
jgi:hypothetical protein